MKTFLLILLLIPSISYAEEYHLLKPQKVSIQAFEYQHYRDSYVAPDDTDIGAGAIFTVNVALLKYKGYGLFWENELFFDQEKSTGQVRHAGWHYKIGATVFKHEEFKLNVFREHMSRHVFDEPRPVKFPTYDRTGAEFIFLDKDM